MAQIFDKKNIHMKYYYNLNCFLFEYILKCPLFLCKSEFSAAIAPVFSVI